MNETSSSIFEPVYFVKLNEMRVHNVEPKRNFYFCRCLFPPFLEAINLVTCHTIRQIVYAVNCIHWKCDSPNKLYSHRKIAFNIRLINS